MSKTLTLQETINREATRRLLNSLSGNLNYSLQKEIDEKNTINMAKIQTVGELKKLIDSPGNRIVRFPTLDEITEEMNDEKG